LTFAARAASLPRMAAPETDSLTEFERLQARMRDPTVYRQRPHALAPDVEFEAGEDALTFEDSKGVTGRIPWGDVGRVRLTFDPARIRQTRHVADIFSRSGQRVRLTSTTFAGMGMYKSRNRAFVAFLETVHARLLARGRDVAYETGNGYAGYVPYLALWLVFLGALVWGAFQMFLGGQNLMAGVLGAMVVYFAFLAYDYARKNRPGSYNPAALPYDILPKPSENDI